MSKMTHLAVTALKDHVSIVTAVKKLQYRKVEGLEGKGMPEGQDEHYENKHGITLQRDQIVEIDVLDSQLPAFQAAVDAGEIEVVMTVASAAPTHQSMTAAAPAPVLVSDKKPSGK